LIDAENPEVDNLVTRRSVTRESKEGINWDAVIGFNLFGGNEANDSANPEWDEAEKSDNLSADEHQEEDSDHHSGSSEENEHTFQSDEDKDA
jgi:hypothetical protein